MPQLFPMNWNLLIMFFSSILMIMTPLIYFNYKPQSHSPMLKHTILSKIWKW
uniref:ATP synthase F0 subunit 8 n=1 Tax=Alectorobius rioplatensis TaxID=487216 RepID=UPI0022388D70|nr:ATP synthase F0 subunit 8 [Alectorobius rioplatensis]UYB78590.1 ATP synthase F0 subunit 8 [Alectorobius rioplatensis]UYB78603.1 ATP synthase F0 subunit 8 [Alectorobius rioplatensis]